MSRATDDVPELYPEYTPAERKDGQGNTPVCVPKPRRRYAHWRLVGEIGVGACLVGLVVFLGVQVSGNGMPEYAVDQRVSGANVLTDQAREETIARLLGKDVASEQADSDALFAESQLHTKELVVGEGNRPAVSAQAYMVSDVLSGNTLLQRDANEKRPIASITKILTALVAEKEIGLETRIFFVPEGQYYGVGDLFFPLFLRSNNTVAENIALYLGEERFVRYMDAYAGDIGMYNTSFGDASGLSPENISTAEDLMTLATYLVEEKKYLLDVSKEQDVTIASMSGREWRVENHNKLSSDPYFLGGKLGYTDEALQTALSIFTIPIDGDMYTIGVVVLGSYDWKQDTRTLLRWLLAHTTTVPVDAEEHVAIGSEEENGEHGGSTSTSPDMVQ
jgi:D-alanyl-D-alanine carboxypeptidase